MQLIRSARRPISSIEETNYLPGLRRRRCLVKIFHLSEAEPLEWFSREPLESCLPFELVEGQQRQQQQQQQSVAVRYVDTVVADWSLCASVCERTLTRVPCAPGSHGYLSGFCHVSSMGGAN